ncbi:unnamed protein product [Ectocarpus sp. CCAP 1310/34]|nr:unnamed protein product [Ectocarpus sp. CCAP 1310/34]
MASYRTDLGSLFPVVGSKQHAFVVPASAISSKRRRVRQRTPSRQVQQQTPVAAGRMLSRDGDRHQQRLSTTTKHDNSVTEAKRRVNGRLVVASRGGGGRSSSNNGVVGRSGDSAADIFTSRNRMMAAARRRRWTEVLEILGHWEENAGRLDAKTYNVALSALGKCGRWKEALATLDRMRSKGVPPDVYSFNSAISACGRAAKWKQALALLSEMEREDSEVRPDLFSYNGAINAVAKDGRWEQALSLLMGIKTRGLSPDVFSFSSAMSACDRAGKWQQALSLLADMPSRGLEANAHAYSSAIHACVVGGQHRRALELLEEMLERRVVPDAAVFTAAMTAVDGWGAALRLLEGVLPDVNTYNAALSVVARSGREDVALALLNRMRIDGYCPDIVTFNTAIDACASREKWQEAVELLEVDMPAAKVKPDVISFTSAIHACAGPTGNWEKAYQLLDAMWQDPEGAKPSKHTYDLVIQACGHGGEWELGVTLIDDMRDLGIKPDAQTFNMAVAACARSGERLAAETLVANMRNARVVPDEFTYASLVAACGRAKEWKRATEIFDEARYVHRIRPSLQIYGALLGALAEGERWADVLVYMDRMVADGVARDAAATNTAVLAAAELGDGRRALSLLEGGEGSQQRGGRQREMVRDAGGEEGGGSDNRLLWDGLQRRRRPAAVDEGDGGRGVVLGQGELEGETEALLGRRQRAATAAGEKRHGEESEVRARTRIRPCPEAARERQGVLGEQNCVDEESEDGTRRTGGDSDSVDDGVGGWEGVTPGLLISVLRALDEQDEDSAVLEAVKRGREKGVLLNPSIYRCALKACGNLGDYDQANDILVRMAEESLTPDIVHWNHALRASAACARWQETRLRLKEMETSGSTPDEFSYSMALKACSAGLWSGDSWCDSRGWGAEEDKSSCRRKNALNGEGQLDGSGDKKEPKVPQACRGKNAIELLQEMKQRGVRLSAHAYTLAMAACLEGHRDRHPELEAGLDKEKGPPSADLRLAEAALLLFDRLVAAGETPTADAYAHALKACARTANPQRANALFWFMLDAASPPAAVQTSSNLSSLRNGASGNYVADGQRRHSRPPSPPQPRPEVRPWHLASAIAAYDAAGDWTGAKQLWDEALRRGVSPRSPGYDAAVSVALRAGDTAAARQLVEEARGLRLELARGYEGD